MRLIDADALIEQYRSMERTCYKLQKALYEMADRKTEPQTPCVDCKSCKWWFGYCHSNECDYIPIEDEPQTERSE